MRVSTWPERRVAIENSEVTVGSMTEERIFRGTDSDYYADSFTRTDDYFFGSLGFFSRLFLQLDDDNEA